MNRIFFLAGVLAAASFATADVTTYQPTRDTFMRGGPTDLHGSSAVGRASKAFLDFYITDFDRSALKSAIESQLGHALTEADMANVELKWYLFSNNGQGYEPQALSRPAVFQGTQDWTEGTNTTTGATKAYAVYDMGTGTGSAWRNRAGDTVPGFLDLNKVQNTAFEEWGGQVLTYRAWTLDDAVAYAYLTDPLSLGLFLNASDASAGGELTDYNNTEVFSREAPVVERRPYLEVTVVPEPGALGVLAAGALGLARRRGRRAGRV